MTQPPPVPRAAVPKHRCEYLRVQSRPNAALLPGHATSRCARDQPSSIVSSDAWWTRERLNVDCESTRAPSARGENPRDCRSSVSISVGRAKYMRCRAESPTPRTAACIDDNSASPDFRWPRTSSPALGQGPQAADQMTIPSMVNDRPAQDRAPARLAGLPGGVRACHHRSSRSRSSTSHEPGTLRRHDRGRPWIPVPSSIRISLGTSLT